MSFVRHEVKEALLRWREALAGIMVSLFGVFWATTSLGLMQIIGLSMVVAGAVLTFAGIQRARFRVGAGGSGLVQIDEGQVIYFGPTDGGSVDVRQLTKIELDPKAKPSAQWVLTEAGMPPLCIPTNAAGADELFDVFATLDGIKTERMLAELRKQPTQKVVIWSAPKLSEPKQIH